MTSFWCIYFILVSFAFVIDFSHVELIIAPSKISWRVCVKKFLEALRIQRWDDHRYYHHCRINQSLHLLSAICFLISYALLFVDPAWAALLAWLVSMVARQSGHFFLNRWAMTTSTMRPTSTKKKSRWVTTFSVKWCCSVFGFFCPWSFIIFQGSLMSFLLTTT